MGDANRPYLWAPIAVRLTSAAGFDGDLVAKSSLGFQYVRRVHVPPGGSERVILPAIDPRKVTAGGATADVPKAVRSPDAVVLVDARLPYASALASDERILYHAIDAADLEKLLSQGLLDACDILLVKEASGLSLGSARSWAVAPSRTDAEKAVAGRPRAAEPVRLVDVELWTLAPEAGWVPAKKDRTILLSALYALAGFGALVFVGRRRARWAGATLVGLSVLGITAFLLFFPRHHLWISESACEIVPAAEGEAMEVRLWFAGAAAGIAPVIQFPRVVKPVFPRLGDAEEPLTLRVDDRGCTAEGFTLPAGRRICFAAVEGRTPSMRALDRAPRPLFSASARRGGSLRYLGDVEAGANIPAEGREGPGPREEEARPWLRFLDGDGICGWLDRADRPAADVGSPDLADGRRRPVFFIQRPR